MKIEKTNNKNKYFYAMMGRIFGNREIYKETNNYLFDDNDKEWFVAKEGFDVVGFVSVKIGKKIFIGNLYVFPEHRKNGLASKLVSRSLKYVEPNIINGLQVVVVANKQSSSLFKKLGFKEKRQTKNYNFMEYIK